MATINNPEDEQQQQPGAPLAVSGTAGASSSGGQGVGVGGAAPQSPVAQNQAPQANTGYTDVGTYLDANKAGSADLGNKVASNLTDTYNQTKSGIDNSAQSTLEASNKGYTPENTDLIQQVVNDPTKVAANDSNSALVQGQLNDKYTGPQNWADFGTQQGNVNQAMQEGALNETPGGLNVLAQQVEGKTGGGQSQGINQLDTLLLGGSPDAMQTVKNAADPFKTLNDYINSQNTAIGGTISANQAAADKARNDANAALLGPSGATTQLNQSIDSQVAAQRQAAQGQIDQIKQALGSENPTPQQLASVGVTGEQWQALHDQLQAAQVSSDVTSANGQWTAGTGTTDIDLTNWLQQQSPDMAINRQNVATADQYARAQALQKLIGSDKFTTDLTDPSQAGTASTNLNKFDYEGALASTSGVWQSERAAAQAYVDAVSQGADEEHAQQAAKNALKNQGMATVANPLAAGQAALGGNQAEDALSAAKNPSSAGSVLASQPAAIQYNTALDVLKHPTLQNVGNAPGNAVKSAVKTVSNIFCFHPDTLIEMADGTLLPICRIDVGDYTKGGAVLSVSKSVGTNFYWYRGVLVTGKHAVKEDGKWLRVESSPLAHKVPNFIEVVHNLVTTKHRIYAQGIEFADEHETDQYEMLDLDQSLEALNRAESLR